MAALRSSAISRWPAGLARARSAAGGCDVGANVSDFSWDSVYASARHDVRGRAPARRRPRGRSSTGLSSTDGAELLVQLFDYKSDAVLQVQQVRGRSK